MQDFSKLYLSIKMELTFKKELARKFVHFLSLFILLIYFVAADYFNSQTALLILVLILIIFLELEYFRIEIPKKIPILNKIWRYVRRDKEKDKLGGDVFFLIGGILALAIFDTRIAIAAILMTTFGDMAAALIGKRFGKIWLSEDRALEGITAEFFVDLVIGYFVFLRSSLFNFSLVFNWQIWILIIIMAVTATFVETIVRKLDDNLLIPIFSGFSGQLALILLNLKV